MKIGIITHYYHSFNYGGNLQAYALCKYLNQQYDAEQICYINKNAKPKSRKQEIREFVEKYYDINFDYEELRKTYKHEEEI